MGLLQNDANVPNENRSFLNFEKITLFYSEGFIIFSANIQ